MEDLMVAVAVVRWRRRSVVVCFFLLHPPPPTHTRRTNNDKLQYRHVRFAIFQIQQQQRLLPYPIVQIGFLLPYYTNRKEDWVWLASSLFYESNQIETNRI